MADRVLISYASRYGSTREIADYIFDMLKKAGLDIHLQRIKDVNDVMSYKSIIIGTPTKMGRLHPDVLRFAKRFQEELLEKMLVYFIVGVTMKTDSPGNREKAAGFLEPLRRIREPAMVGLFAGKVDYGRIGYIWKKFASLDKTGIMGEGDFRDWDAIRQWTGELIPVLKTA